MFFWLLFLSLFLLQKHTANFQFNLYHTHQVSNNVLYYDCLLDNEASTHRNTEYIKNENRQPYQTIPFCIRPPDSSSKILIKIIHGTSIEFETLKKQNVTSEQLYLSSASIDVVEQYQAYLENSNSSLSPQIFNNCSKPWFGEYCQYSFNLTSTFNEIVRYYFQRSHSEEFRPYKYGSCYTFLKCHRDPSRSCLDWREICDGKIDCLNGGQDEIDCEKLDLSECKEDEYRCNNGFCIPKEFFNDDDGNPDCMDRSDERYYHFESANSGNMDCYRDPTFRCEETKCRNERTLSCGDGQCTVNGCENNQDAKLKYAKLSQQANSNLSVDCWTSLICLTTMSSYQRKFFNDVECGKRNDTENLFREKCSLFSFFPAEPILLGHVYFVYANNLTTVYESGIFLPHYVCYDQDLCDWLPATVLINGFTCRILSELDRGEESISKDWYPFEINIRKFFLKCSTIKSNHVNCPKSKPFRCANSSKCIALNRLADGFVDCFQGDDEKILDSCLLPDIDYRFRCSSEQKCIPMISSNSKNPICVGKEDGAGMLPGVTSNKFYVSFMVLCDGFIDHSNIDGLNYTDEMDCENWPCNNIYTRCNGRWDCRNAIDEANCTYNPCRPNRHSCVLPQSHDFMCLPLSRINDGHVDCLGGLDETDDCGPMTAQTNNVPYRCFNETECIPMRQRCNPNIKYCSSGYDYEFWCIKFPNASIQLAFDIDYEKPTDFDYHFYNRLLIKKRSRGKAVISYFFTVNNHYIYPDIKTISSEYNSITTTTATQTITSNPFDSESLLDLLDFFNFKFIRTCNHGISVYVNNLTEISCLCPPAYFGFRCEYQNQRISLTLLFRTIELRTIFTFVLMLIDEDTNIHSSEQLDYLSVRDCQKIFNIYLLYSTQPKGANQTYYVRIDSYKKETLEYYISTIYPIKYSFLPVHRLSLRVDVPIPRDTIKPKFCPLKCLHGQCRKFSNSDKYFCQCFDGYSGMLCQTRNKCDCSSDSKCLGIVNNRSICICPLDKFGPRCYMKKTSCASISCPHTGRCIPGDETFSSKEYFCLCSQSYLDPTCKGYERRIEFSFAPTIIMPQAIFINFFYIIIPHFFIHEELNVDPISTTMIAKLKPYETSAFVYYGGEFSLIFVEFHQQYYLALLQHNSTSNVNISTKIIPEHRCLSVKDLLPDHIQNLSRWHRAKYYQIPCEKNPNLTCFYDNDYFMCLCDKERFANCFKYNYRPSYNCFGYNYCENDGQCYQDNNTCPTSSSCFCKECYFGSQCQFTTTQFGLSLDDIFGYSIWPNVPFTRQSITVKVATAITIIMFIIAIINSVLCIITFQTKKSLAIGTGVYLIAQSITSILTMTLFALKFLFLILSQTSTIKNYYFLISTCICTDMFLKAFLAIGDWLNACVSIERTLTVQLGVKFDKVTSKKVAQKVISGLYLFILASFIHDPFHRHLLEDIEEQRTWCITRYSSSMTKYASFMNIFHFIVPFSINLISIILMIISIARNKSKSQQKQTYKKHLQEQFHQHKHRLFSSLVLFLIGMPRLIISLASKCMESARNPWLYLSGYFISFIPPLLVMIIFVLPSEFYRKEFKEATVRIQKTFKSRFRRE